MFQVETSSTSSFLLRKEAPLADNDKIGVFVHQPVKKGYQPTDGRLDTSNPPGSSDQSSSSSEGSDAGGESESNAAGTGSTDKDS